MGTVAQAAGLFAVTNVDDLLLLAVYFGQGGPAWRIVAGQYLGFAAILAVAVAAALGAALLPASALPYLGLVPLALGLKAARSALRGGDDAAPAAPGVLGVAAVTLANGGDNVGVYVPVFATAGAIGVHGAVFLALVAVWCGVARALVAHPAAGRALARTGHVVLPVVLIAIGAVILSEA